jgi:DNA mismatch repair ATPase MutL
LFEPCEHQQEEDNPGASESQQPASGASGAAERELERVFDKRDFRNMAIIGQFNLGFILAR